MTEDPRHKKNFDCVEFMRPRPHYRRNRRHDC